MRGGGLDERMGRNCSQTLNRLIPATCSFVSLFYKFACGSHNIFMVCDYCCIDQDGKAQAM